MLIQFELMTFRFVYGRTSNSSISLISGFLDVSLAPEKNLLFIFGDSRTPKTNQEISKCGESIFYIC